MFWANQNFFAIDTIGYDLKLASFFPPLQQNQSQSLPNKTKLVTFHFFVKKQPQFWLQLQLATCVYVILCELLAQIQSSSSKSVIEPA